VRWDPVRGELPSRTVLGDGAIALEESTFAEMLERHAGDDAALVAEVRAYFELY
jgi:hypothetical protein